MLRFLVILALIAATRTSGDSAAWADPPLQRELQWDIRIVIAEDRPVPGVYHATIEIGPDGKPLIVRQFVTIGDEPAPQPDPPTPQPTNLSAAVASEVAKVVKPETHAEWIKLADAYAKVAGLIESKSLATVDAVKITTPLLEALATSTIGDQWAAIKASTVEPRLTITTVQDYIPAWKEIAAGIKAGAGAQPPPDPPQPAGPLKVLILREKDDDLPLAQERIFTSSKVLGWLQTNAPQRWHVWDDDTKPEDVSAEFRKALEDYQKARDKGEAKAPWIIATNGTAGCSKPLPDNDVETLALLEKYKR